MVRQNEEVEQLIQDDAVADTSERNAAEGSEQVAEVHDTTDAEKIGFNTYLTRIILYLTPILFVPYCCYYILSQTASTAIRFSRYLSAWAALFMIASIILMAIKIWYWQSNPPRTERVKQHVSMTVSAFIGTLSALTFIGYVKMLPTIFVLYNYDVALDYTNIIEVWLDLFYNFVFVIFLPLLFTYSVIYAPRFKTYEKMTNILLCTHLLCFLQKWMFETLTINEHICQEMLEDDLTYNCTNRLNTHFNSSLQNFTSRERHLYDSLINESPYMYTFTMELLPANAALLVSLRRQPHIAKTVTFIGSGISKLSKKIAYALLSISITIFSLALLGQPIVGMLYDNHKLKEGAMLGNGAARLVGHMLSTALFSIVRRSYSQQSCSVTTSSMGNSDATSELAHPNDQLGTSSPDSSHEESSSSLSNEIPDPSHTGSVFDRLKFKIVEPDLLILFISGWFTFLLQLGKFFVHLLAYIFLSHSHMTGLSITQVFLNDIASFVLIVSFYVQYKTIETFITFNKQSMKLLREPEHKFVIFFAPGAFIINVLRFGAIYLSNANYLPPYPTNSIFFDNLLSILDSAYPGSLLYSMTAAICWGHIIERLYHVGAYRVVPDDH